MLDIFKTAFDALHTMRELGGPVVSWIFLSCVLMWAIVIERYWYFRKVLPLDSARLLQQWHARENKFSWASRHIRAAMVSQLNAAMSSRLQVLRVLVPMCPLLGLLGTVSGMLGVFDAMAARGSADARSMASGVSEAMICTLSGLAVSITGLYPVYYFRRRVSRETELLSDKFTY
jgi:biopolymer transport protein ExbB